MNKLPIICECGFNTMDARKAAEHAKKHEEYYCPKCGQAWIVHDGDGSCIED